MTHPICVECATQKTLDPDERGHHACDECGLVVNTGAALTRSRVELGHLEGTLRFSERCDPDGNAIYWTCDFGDHVVSG